MNFLEAAVAAAGASDGDNRGRESMNFPPMNEGAPPYRRSPSPHSPCSLGASFVFLFARVLRIPETSTLGLARAERNRDRPLAARSYVNVHQRG